ncbi:MAG: DUF1667 domain-containing protein [Clostridiales bacterium]|nr:DUF1667 domain-containing protein [Clostridiales bacterium]
MREVICIVCPKGCHLKIEENGEGGYNVSGASCERGIDYGINEVTNPVRVLTSTVKVEGGSLVRCPVRTDGSVPKEKIFACMEEINNVTLSAPIEVGDVVIEDIAGTGVALIATRCIS